jgi:hypothetical protein
MLYPTCYVYKIGTNDDLSSSNENSSTNKKSRKCKSPTRIIDQTSNTDKTETSLIKNFANNLLISAQRNNCIDVDKKYTNNKSRKSHQMNFFF